ncbi:FecR family protein [Chitinophaga sp. GCM10012297]|uniref:FecR domain-containing protein n=1 Tax=Chitinophaga chungangae TaxID=2821488 RepID=A0ABS3YDH9_9BACT|nr:FecR family protein [Chitinophaga chungangae]MBO9152169.1 FecR domain-containing protein [Chitinophaga chungangae]
MEAHALYELLEKYRQGACSPEELERLERWYASLGKDRPDHLLEEGSETARLLTEQKLQELHTAVGREQRVVPFRKRALRWAAVLAGLIALAGGAAYYFKPTSRQSQLAKEYRIPAAHVRHITLPDSSLVILRAGSRLEYPEVFNGGTREVTLVGEAYFDIRRDTSKTFVIHSGRLRTTVLGTAFNIKAYEGASEITVSVTRGKVKVETEHEGKLLAVLMPDQQVVYNNLEAAAIRQPVIADSAIQWVRKDMVFENLPFATVTQAIAARYHINIRFENEELASCPIRASFNGTESLETILSVVCDIRNASYIIEDENNILITGEGCQPTNNTAK